MDSFVKLSFEKPLRLKAGLLTLIFDLLCHVNVKHRRHMLWLVGLMVISAISEVFTIGAVMPFVAVLATPERLFDFPRFQLINNYFHFNSPEQLVLPVVLIFGFLAILTGVIRLFLLFFTTRMSFSIGSDLSLEIYRRTLHQPYRVHISRNSSEVINVISSKVDLIISAIFLNGLTLISSILILLIILGVLLTINFKLTLMTLLGFGLIYLTIVRLTRKTLLLNSQKISSESINLTKSLREGLGGIRDILVDGTQESFIEMYRKTDISLRRAQSVNHFIGHSPRFLMESLGMFFIAFLAYFLTKQTDEFSAALPTLAVVGLGAQRMLPLLQQIYASITGMLGSKATLVDVLKLLRQAYPKPMRVRDMNISPVSFNRYIQFKNVSFRHKNADFDILDRVNLKIKKGDRIGIIGKTGSGKSTLLDILMALLEPSKGLIEVDGISINANNAKSWQSILSHVPQHIFLADSSIAENIAFGLTKREIDFTKVALVAKKAQLSDFISKLPDQYNSRVGEFGIHLSGGQRQRIGIARALYKDAAIIVMDEATSALDDKTEDAIMDSIESMDKKITILMVAHRIQTLKNCDWIVELQDGRIKNICTYDELVKDSHK